MRLEAVPGDVSDYTVSVRASLQQKIAEVAEVDASLVTIDVFPAGSGGKGGGGKGGGRRLQMAHVDLVFTIAVPASKPASTMQGALAESGAVVGLLNEALDGIVKVEVGMVVPMIRVILEPSSPPPPSPCTPAEGSWPVTISVSAGMHSYVEEASWTLHCEGMCEDIFTLPGDMHPLLWPSPSAMGGWHGDAPQEMVVYQNTISVQPGAACTLTMEDTYGDGWNGAKWKAPGLLDADAPDYPYSVDTGYSKVVTFFVPWSAKPIASPSPPPPPSPVPKPCQPPDDTWVNSPIHVSRGDYPTEVSWRLSCSGMCGDIHMPSFDGAAPDEPGMPPLYHDWHSVPPLTLCELTMEDTYGDGWNGASWEAPGLLGADAPDYPYSIDTGYSKVVTFTTPRLAIPMPSPSPYPEEFICSVCEPVIYENDCPLDWESQKDYVNWEAMRECTITMIDACHSAGGSDEMCSISLQMLNDLGWTQPEDFEPSFFGCVPAVPCRPV
jgi:hypothetical protein